MALSELSLARDQAPLPGGVRSLLREADRRIGRFLIRGRIPAFVPSDYEGAFRVLRGLIESPDIRGTQFCEWGSGFGAVTCLAEEAGFDACGIEAEAELVDQARRLAEDFGLAADFAHGSYIPPGAEDDVYAGGVYSWLTTDSDHAYQELGLDVADLDVIFAYPWPDEEALTAELFDRYAGPGAVLVTYHTSEGFRARRKTVRRTQRRTRRQY
jgi:hypothetical protein